MKRVTVLSVMLGLSLLWACGRTEPADHQDMEEIETPAATLQPLPTPTPTPTSTSAPTPTPTPTPQPADDSAQFYNSYWIYSTYTGTHFICLRADGTYGLADDFTVFGEGVVLAEGDWSYTQGTLTVDGIAFTRAEDETDETYVSEQISGNGEMIRFWLYRDEDKQYDYLRALA